MQNLLSFNAASLKIFMSVLMYIRFLETQFLMLLTHSENYTLQILFLCVK